MAVFLSILAVVGSLAGVVLGVNLATRAQKKHWILNSKKEEYRELLSVLTQSYSVLFEFYSPLAVGRVAEEQRAVSMQEMKAMAVLQDRLFISSEVENLQLVERWRAAVLTYQSNRDTSPFARSVGGIITDITNSAKKITE